MKKLIAFLLAVLLLTIPFSALGEGKLETTQLFFFVTGGYSPHGNMYARIENVGDEPVALGNGIMALYSQDGEVLIKNDHVSPYRYGRPLQPGEYEYVSAWCLMDGKEDQVAECKFTPGVLSSGSGATRMVESSAELSISESTSSQAHSYLFVTITNTGDEPLDVFAIQCAVLDQNGNLLYVTYDYVSEIAVHPGSTITVRFGIDDDLIKYCRENQLVPTTADSIVYDF